MSPCFSVPILDYLSRPPNIPRMSLDQLNTLCEELRLLSSTASVLNWDQETYMPQDAVQYRAKQISYLKTKAHELKTSPEFQQALEAAEDAPAPTPHDAANLRDWRTQFDRNTKLPTSFVEEFSQTTTLANSAWGQAKDNSDFSTFEPHLAKIVDFTKQKADLFGYQNEPYEALMNLYEDGLTVQEVEGLFTQLHPELIKLQEATKERRLNPLTLPPGSFPQEQQACFNQQVAASLGFDFNKGRIDTTSHPFCTTLGPEDVRLTTRYDENDFTSSLFGVMHETGHGLYEQGLPSQYHHLPVGDAVSLGIHESQSLFWETHVGRSEAFWQKWFPVAVEHFPALSTMELDQFIQYIHRPHFTPIRVDSDEVSYDLHIILRFRIERMLLNGEITTKQVPETWNDLFHESFGVYPENDAKGCLQDIHWSFGGLGYFPTYTLGNIISAQLFNTAMEDQSIASAFATADFSPTLDWLRSQIHTPGRLLTSNDLVKQATGAPINTDSYLAHLTKRYA